MFEDLKKWTQWLLGWLCVFVTISWLYGMTPIGRDDTDPVGWGAPRSGIKPRTDALTGCQYLQASGGGLIPRFDASGKHIGCAR
ncbi:MAG: hypothetical protein H7255_09050 [Ramlibacter sp.]|nr:hypothetical protein [Ramlibacter sp.]